MSKEKQTPDNEIRVAIRPEQAAILTREHQQMTATIQQAQGAFLHSLALLSVGQVPEGAAFDRVEKGPDGVPNLVFHLPDAPAVPAAA